MRSSGQTRETGYSHLELSERERDFSFIIVIHSITTVRFYFIRNIRGIYYFVSTYSDIPFDFHLHAAIK